MKPILALCVDGGCNTVLVFSSFPPFDAPSSIPILSLIYCIYCTMSSCIFDSFDTSTRSIYATNPPLST
ncbi:hypothetical protein CI102_11126 [Trichoderma harzianum]|nr:hypothetical protein CI102_11126 [Trichoderma harzianum]